MRKEDSSSTGMIVTEILQHLHACNNSVKVSKLPSKGINFREILLQCRYSMEEKKTLNAFMNTC